MSNCQAKGTSKKIKNFHIFSQFVCWFWFGRLGTKSQLDFPSWGERYRKPTKRPGKGVGTKYPSLDSSTIQKTSGACPSPFHIMVMQPHLNSFVLGSTD